MKKYLMTGVAALALCAGFTACSQDDFEFNEDEYVQNQEALIKATYQQAFVNAFGQPAKNHTWGFTTPAAATRTVSVAGDAYDKFPSAADVAANFPTSIPSDADEVADLETLYTGTTVQTQYGDQILHNLYFIYQYKIVEGYNLKVTKAGTVELGGSYQNAGWDGAAQMNLAYPYNVYVDVDGDLTIRRNGATHFNLYILRGNVTLESNYGEQAGLISVAAGATLNDQRNSIAANQGVKLFNRGTVNATNTEKYDIGNFCTVYNEGKFNVSGPLTYSPGDANDSYFMNLGDNAELTAPAMTLNSTGNFFNSGKVTIEGATTVTQARLYWVNAGFYTTGSMTFSAKNTTFFNYCQLIVEENAHMYDGEFNLMTNGYIEASTAEFDNFIVNMGNNSCFNVKGDTDWGPQGDGTYQGFKTNASNAYVRLGGTATVAAHMYSFEISGNITYAINSINDLGASNTGVQPTYRFNAGTTEASFADITVTPKTNSCGFDWDGGGPTPKKARIICEDMSAKLGNYKGDFDFNDAVFDLYLDENDIVTDIELIWTGAEFDIEVDGKEIHEYLGVPKGKFSTKEGSYKFKPSGSNWHPIDVPVKAYRHWEEMVDGQKKEMTGILELEAKKGMAPGKIQVDPSFQIVPERTPIDEYYENFKTYVQDPTVKFENWR